MSPRARPHLRLIPSELRPDQPEPQGQLSLPFASDCSVLVLVDLTNASENEFLRVLEQVRPDAVIELRAVPRFDFGRLNRKAVFRKFDEMHARYHDLIYSLRATAPHDAGLNPAFVASPLAEILKAHPRPQRALVLLDDPKMLDLSLEVLPSRLQTEPPWEVRHLARA
jgi:hypothetical protein